MVLRRSYAKLKDARDPHRLQVQKRATKVHAQRKFAQGAGLTNSPPAMTSSVREKDKSKMNGTGAVPAAPVIPAKRPRTEDFITFLCFRGTDKLPPELNHFNTPSKPDKTERDFSSTGSSKHSLNTSEESPKAKNKTNNVASGARQGRSPVLPLKSKILDKRMAAKQKIALSKLNHKVRTSAVLRARQRTLPTEHPKKTKGTALTGKINRSAHTTRSSHPSILKRLGASRLRAGLRSSGQLPPGSDDGIKTDRKSPKESSDNKTEKKVLPKRSNQKVNKSEISRKSSEKSGRMATRSKKKSPSPVRLPKTPNVVTRPSRKTKEAATLYMEIITKDLRSPDDEDGGVLTGRDETVKEEKTDISDRRTRATASKQLQPSTPVSTNVVGKSSSKRDSVSSLSSSPSKEKLPKRKDSSSVEEPLKRPPRKQTTTTTSVEEETAKKSELTGTATTPAALVSRRTRSSTMLESEDESPPVIKSTPTKPAKSPSKKAVKCDNKSNNNKLSQAKGKPASKKLNSNSEVESSQETEKEAKKVTRSNKPLRKSAQNDSEDEEKSLSRAKFPTKKSQPIKQETKTVRVTRSSTIEEDQPEQIKVDVKKSTKRKETDRQELEVPKRTRRSKQIETDSEEEVKEVGEASSVKKLSGKLSEENNDVSPARKGKKPSSQVPSKSKEEPKEESMRRGRSSKKVEPVEASKASKEKTTAEEEDYVKQKKSETQKEVKKGRKKAKETEESDKDLSGKEVEPPKKPKDTQAEPKSKKCPAKTVETPPTRPARKTRKPAKSESDDSESEDVSYSRRSSRRIAMKYNEATDSSEDDPVLIPDRPKRSSRAVVHLYDINSDSEEDFLANNEDEEEYVEPKKGHKEEPPANKVKKTKKSQEATEETKENFSVVETKPETDGAEAEPPKTEQETVKELSPSEIGAQKDAKIETNQKEDEKTQEMIETKQVGVEAGTQISEESHVVENATAEEPPRTRRRVSREEHPPTPPLPTLASVTSSHAQTVDKPVEQPKLSPPPKKSQDSKPEPDLEQATKDGEYNDLDTLAAAASLISLQTRKVILNRKPSIDSSRTNLAVEKPKISTEEKKADTGEPPGDSDESTASSEVESKTTRRKRLPRRLRREPVRLQPPNRPVRSRRAKVTDYRVDEDSFSSDRSSSPEVMPSSNKRQISNLLKKSEESREAATLPTTQKSAVSPEKIDLPKQVLSSAQPSPPIPVGKTLPRQRATPLPARPDQMDSETLALEKDIFRKRSLLEETDALKTNLFNLKSISDNASVLATADIKPKPSIGDTWIQAFKNVKIPKPGQLSPAHHSSSPPFVRKPQPQAITRPEDLRRHVQQFPSTSTARLPNFQTLRVGHLQNSGPSKTGNQSPSRLNQAASQATSPDGKSKHVYLTPSKAPEEPKNDAPVPSKTLTHLQYEKRSQDFISSLKEPPTVKQYATRTLKETVEKDLSRTSSPALDDASKPTIPEGGKHLNLPPVEHTLRKMSPITVSKKPMKVDKKSSPVPDVKPSPSSASKVEIKQVSNLELLNKMRVNMTHQEINGWMNDSTSSGIEHARDCGIFENNQCGCSFRTSGDSMRNSVSVTGLMVKDETKVDHGVVEPPVQLKELDSVNHKFTAETISTCKVDDYKEKLMSKAHKTTETQKDAFTQRVQKMQQTSRVGFEKAPKRKPSMTEEEMYGFDFRFERGSYSRESGSDMSSPTPRDDVSVSNDETPQGVLEQRKAIFHQRRAMSKAPTGGGTVGTPGGSASGMKRPSLSKSPSAFSAENESSVYAFEPDPPPPPSSIKQPFRRRGSRHKSNEEETVASSSIAVQVNFETEKVLECSTQTEQVENDGQLFYFPIEAESSPTQVIQGVQLKLQSAEGPDQRVFMKAKLVTKPSPTFPKPSSSRPATQKPEQKVRPLASTAAKLPVGAVQPTVREPVPPAMFTSQGTTTSPQLANQSTQSSRPPTPPPGVSTSTGPLPSSSRPLDLASKATTTTPSISSSPAPSTSSTVETSTVALPPSKGLTKSAPKMKSASNTFPKPGSCPTIMEAPTFYPTEKEFQDPLEYIEQITPLARTFGICRIVPPSSFKPECKVSDDMRFTAYNQYVHKMLHRWGPNVREMSAIKKYLATQSIALNQLPWIGGMEIDLPRLYQTVQMCGGLKEVIEKKRWAKVADAMKIPKSAQDRVTKLDDIYCKFLLPYDTLSHDERSKLLTEVDIEWDARERRLADEADREKDDSDSESDSDERDECITKGRTMPLSGFYRIARNTMAMWFKEPNPGSREVESEYWKHVTTRTSHICVNSGSIDTGSMGFGFPTSKTSTTSRHPWNLKVLTNNSGSVLRSIGPVMGVTVPTLHVGMLFSACCWYRDPHGLPWVEYLHTGASKIWYCVPDSWSEQLRFCLKRLLPRHCVDKPIWLASDTAMVPPDLLNHHGVSLCRTVQEPGQFILVFPKAYTSTVCTGYVVSESVYFAQPSWLATAKSIFKDIQESCEPPAFSLEKLLFNIAADSRTPLEVLSQVLPMIVTLKSTEMAQRKKVSELGLVASEKLHVAKGRKRSQEEVEYECEICRGNLFLSLVREERPSSEEEMNYCLVHAAEILEKDKGIVEHCKLMVTYEEEEMTELIDKLKAKIELKTQKRHGKSSTTTSVSKA